ncbi:phasin family protein [Uliginosibacterium sp. sgz301328]|uniref:phasin family protein n=1 Tax=Uliginosibacterium sp. sgz301328 TaxID=3243764 RepID=UPI00359CD995
MASNQEALGALQKKNLDAAMELAQLSIENSQRILELQMQAARDIFESGVSSARAVAQASTPQEALQLRSRYAQETTEKMLACSRGIAQVATELQIEMGRLVSQQFAESGSDVIASMQGMFKNTPLSNDAATKALQDSFDTARRTLEQVVQASSAAFGAATGQGARKPRK